MTARQRVLEAVACRQPDRVPIDFWAADDVYDRLRDAWGLGDDEAVRRRIGVDLRYYDGPALAGERRPPDAEGVVTDHWGVQRKLTTVHGARRDGSRYRWTYKHLHASPLAPAETVADVERHPWPSADLWDYSGVQDACRRLRATGCAVVAGADRLDRAAQLKPAMYLRGAERFLADLVLRPGLAECILARVADYYLAYNRRLLAAGDGSFDIFFMGDDMGTQASTWVSPEMYRRFFRPRLAAYCQLAHDHGLKVMYHTCGRVTPLVGDFLDAGVDVLQSLQPAAMGEEIADLKRRFGRRLCFQGGIDIQQVLPRGTPAEVAEHVRSRAEILAPGGGYIFGTAHNILPDAPTGNLLALVAAYHEHGRY